MIDRFDNSMAFLSNFHECTVTYDGRTFGSSEAAYQSSKCLSGMERNVFTRLSARDAKNLGRKITLRPNWDEIKDQVMYEVVKAKFTQNEELKMLLLATGEEVLVEGNYWKDTYWGVCNGEGLNRLGEILMKVRSKLKEVNGCECSDKDMS